MDYLKANFDRVLLVAAGLWLAGVAIYSALGRGSLTSDFPIPAATGKTAPFQPSPEIALLAAEEQKLAEPATTAWVPPTMEEGGSLFVSRVYLLRDGGLVDLYDSDVQLYGAEGIPNSWVLQHNLDYTDQQLPVRDPDNDGFSNQEEYAAGKDPNNPTSKPDAWIKLRLVSGQREQLRLRFMSLPSGTLDEVAINTMSPNDPSKLSGSTQFYPRAREEVRTPGGEIEKIPKDILLLAGRTATGEEVFEETPFRFLRAERRTDKDTGEEVIVAILRNEVDEELFELPREAIKDSPFSLATLQDSRDGGQSWTLRSGKEFELDGQAYKLIDVSGENATIQKVSSGDLIDVSATGATLKDPSSGDATDPPRPETDATATPPTE